MPQLRQYVSKHGYVPPQQIRILKRAGTTPMQKRGMSRTGPGYITKHLSEILSLPGLRVQHSNPEHTRANEVMEHRENRFSMLAAPLRRQEIQRRASGN